MSNIGNAMGRMFGGPPEGFQGKLTAIIREHGTVTAAARAMGVDRRTVQRWQSGAIHSPRPATADKVDKGFREARARGRSIPDDSTVRVTFTQRAKGGRDRERQVDGDKLGLAPGTMRGARDAYVAAGPEAAATAFVAGIGDDWYHDIFEDDLTGEGDDAGDTASDPAPTSVRVS